MKKLLFLSIFLSIFGGCGRPENHSSTTNEPVTEETVEARVDSQPTDNTAAEYDSTRAPAGDRSDR